MTESRLPRGARLISFQSEDFLFRYMANQGRTDVIWMSDLPHTHSHYKYKLIGNAARISPSAPFANAMAAAQLCPLPVMSSGMTITSPSQPTPLYRKETLRGSLQPNAIENLILSLNSDGFSIKEFAGDRDDDEKKKNRRKHGKKRTSSSGGGSTQMSRGRQRNRQKSLMGHIATQIEYIFGYQNLPFDFHLQSSMDGAGFVAAVDLLHHPRVKGLAHDVETIVDAVRGHPLIEVVVRTPTVIYHAHAYHAHADEPVPMLRRLSRHTVILNQLEYCFSDENLAADTFLGKLIANDAFGYVPVAVFIGFNRFLSLHVVEREIADVAVASSMLEISADRKFVRRRQAELFPSPSPSPPLFNGSPPMRMRMAMATGNAEQTAKFVRKQVEYYFSVQNFLFDRFLQQLAHQCTSGEASTLAGEVAMKDMELYGGWVFVSELVKFPRLASLNTAPADVVAALEESSTMVELSKDKRLIRRKEPLPAVPPVVKSSGIAMSKPLSLPEHDDSTITTMQYNVLADHLAHESWFPYAGEEVRSWHRRRELIKREILYHSPDLLCLQEVQSCYIEKPDGSVAMASSGHLAKENHVTWFTNWLHTAEYGWHYARKSPGIGQTAQGISIGNMICWKEKVFKVIEEKNVYVSKEIAQCFPDNEVNVLSTSQMKEFCQRSAGHFCDGYGQVACMVRLHHILTGKELILATIHLTANYQAPHVQVMQTQACLKRLETFSQLATGRLSPHAAPRRKLASKLPIILCGDFNCTPESGVVQLLQNGSLDNTHSDLALAKESRLILPYPNPQHNLKLTSSHHWVTKHVGSKESSPPSLPLTNCTHNFQGTLDYVWFTPERGLEMVAAFGGIPAEELSKETGLPNSRFPSDHLPVLCQLKLTEKRF